MGHIINAKEEIYFALAERLSKTPEGAPINEHLMEILHRLYTESEALVGSKFSSIPMPLSKISSLSGIEESELKVILDGMSDKGLVLDIPRKDTFYYMLAPMLVGFFEYTFMRTGDDVNLKELAELFETYFHSPGVMKEIAGMDTKVMRTLIYENVIPLAVETEVLDYEKATEIIRQSGGGAISICACRHEASHLGTACDAPTEVCMSLGGAAEWIIRKGLGKPASVDDLLKVLKQTQELGLVHLCDNVLNKPTYICNCCGCCCKVLRGINEQQVFATHPSNFMPLLELDSCIGCGICAEKCQIHAITMSDREGGSEIPVLNNEVCIGCGACSVACPSESLTMSRRSVLSVPPENVREKFKRMALEKGR
ncbi:4Fe-4S dicluster domain-containing protein [Desulfosporosinus sp.]|uniref:4Fe-4S dicluster domain-containing protein n=1 Tax=Desulfosporosinus sp. TaxID=157907 RepID=UPI002325C3DB|nr:4Fe-4S dicluster domain-containing protein [Desulfosporosinus sp.]MCO5387213.1 4Fe-4S dicluster domain-containing protein [Desulfosporosinus sp.]MDA8221271.1 4Fe-4S dicluster domain-containing protein [Desulfitobacterium hafniense]